MSTSEHDVAFGPTIRLLTRQQSGESDAAMENVMADPECHEGIRSHPMWPIPIIDCIIAGIPSLTNPLTSRACARWPALFSDRLKFDSFHALGGEGELALVVGGMTEESRQALVIT